MADTLPIVTITSDGAARGNPGPGGWAALLETADRQRLLSGEGPAHTTNNAMEIYAVIAALEALKRPCRVQLRLDSQYVLGGLERLLAGGALPEKNGELWTRLRTAAQLHQISTEWVRGHNGDERNEQVDRAANAAANRAYIATKPAPTADADAEVWTLALGSPGANRPARWALITPTTRRNGSVAVQGITQPTAMYQALAQALTAARQVAGAAEAVIRIVSNYELIIKQGRGEWQVKNPAQRRLAEQIGALRSELGELRFEFETTEQVLKQLEAADG